MKKITINGISVNELSYPLPRPVEIDEGDPSCRLWNTMMSMRVEWQKDYDELQKYKAIEKERGVGLITIARAFKDGIWSKGGYLGYCCLDNEPHFINPDEIELGIYWYQEKKHGKDSEFSLIDKEALCLYTHWHEDIEYAVRVKDFGKTWAFTKEELE